MKHIISHNNMLQLHLCFESGVVEHMSNSEEITQLKHGCSTILQGEAAVGQSSTVGLCGAKWGYCAAPQLNVSTVCNITWQIKNL